LKVHTLNYRIEGTADVSLRDLAALAHEHNVPQFHDLGSGTLVDLARYGLAHEPTVREAMTDGADIVTFSGDTLGGPQMDFIVGRRDLIAAVNDNPTKRALRVDKIRFAALETTLKLYRDPDRLAKRLSTLHLLARKLPALEAPAARLAPLLGKRLDATFTVERVVFEGQVGALPLETIASFGVSLRPRNGSGHAPTCLTDALHRPSRADYRADRGRRADTRSALPED
jgi:L-seryl-tRNA(Ser) seleniumtransferase